MRIRSPKHRTFVASQPCVITGYQGERGIAHHLLRITGERGTGMKTSDIWCLPLEFTVHDALHKNGNEIVFFANHGMDYEDVKEIALNYGEISPDKKVREAVKLWRDK